MVADVRIREGRPTDSALLTELARRTFIDTYGPHNTASDLDAYVAAHFGGRIQARELSDPEMAYRIAEVEGVPAGYALVRSSPMPAGTGGPPAGGTALEIQRLYVDTPWKGTGVAQALMDACVREARRRGAVTLWLGVWESNPRAIRFYEKSGFRDVGSHVFLLGSDPQTDRILVRDLGADGERLE